jgi:hypothetical protein
VPVRVLPEPDARGSQRRYLGMVRGVTGLVAPIEALADDGPVAKDQGGEGAVAPPRGGDRHPDRGVDLPMVE